MKERRSVLEIVPRSRIKKEQGTPRLGVLTAVVPLNGFAVDRHVLHCNCHGAACSAAAVVGFLRWNGPLSSDVASLNSRGRSGGQQMLRIQNLTMLMDGFKESAVVGR
jgi:hypothetical protein